MSVYKAQDASDLSDNYIKQQKMINALGGHFQDPVAEKRYAEENVGPVFGMSNTPNTDGSSDMVAMTHNPLMNPSMNNDSSFSSSSSSSSSSSFSSSTSSSSIGGRRGQGSFVTRVGGSSVNHLDNHTSNSNIGSQVMNQQSSSSRMYYGFDPTISMSDKTGDNDDQEEREPSNLSMNPSFISNVSMYQPRTSSAGSRRSSDLMRGSMNNSMISSSSSNINVSGSSKKQLSQGQGGFFTNEENPFVLFNKPAAESPRPILEKNIQ
jgi:hypothetical protein